MTSRLTEEQPVAVPDPLLVCPKCRRPLAGNGYSDGLRCDEHGHFPIIDGIPSLAPRSETFDDHWTSVGAPELPPEKRARARGFLEPLKEALASATAPILALDAGCGDGVHVAVLSEDAGDRVRLTALDLSFDAVRTARGRGGSDWRYVHGDVLELPFDDASFDVVFSYGVIAYTGDSVAALRELVRVTKPGGRVGVWVYPRRTGALHRLFEMTRAIVVRLPKFLQRRFADCIVPFLGVLPTASGVHLGNATWRQCREVVLVNVAPPQLRFYTRQELGDEMDAAGLAEHAETVDAPITLWGRKR